MLIIISEEKSINRVDSCKGHIKQKRIFSADVVHEGIKIFYESIAVFFFIQLITMLLLHRSQLDSTRLSVRYQYFSSTVFLCCPYKLRVYFCYIIQECSSIANIFGNLLEILRIYLTILLGKKPFCEGQNWKATIHSELRLTHIKARLVFYAFLPT